MWHSYNIGHSNNSIFRCGRLAVVEQSKHYHCRRSICASNGPEGRDPNISKLARIFRYIRKRLEEHRPRPQDNPRTSIECRLNLSYSRQFKRLLGRCWSRVLGGLYIIYLVSWYHRERCEPSRSLVGNTYNSAASYIEQWNYTIRKRHGHTRLEHTGHDVGCSAALLSFWFSG